MHPQSFTNRPPHFSHGYDDFFMGRLSNPYSETRSDAEWFANREWQAGQNLAYADHQVYWSTQSKD